MGCGSEVWRSGGVPPLPELIMVGELAQAVAEGKSDIGLDEVGMLLAARFVGVVSGRRRKQPAARSQDRIVACAAFQDKQSCSWGRWRPNQDLEALMADPIPKTLFALISGSAGWGVRFPDDIEQHVDVGFLPLPGEDAANHAIHPARAFATRRALTARFGEV